MALRPVSPLAHVATVLALACVLGGAPAARALSPPVCDEGGSVWVTERPFFAPTFPGSDLLFFCEGGLNIDGIPISPCSPDGACDAAAAAQAVCKVLGFDAVWADDVGVVNAKPTEAVRALSGGAPFCLRAGVWAAAVPDGLASMAGSPCLKLDHVTCIRHRATMVSALATPASESSSSPATTAELPVTSAATAPMVTAADGSSGSGGGRKLLRH